MLTPETVVLFILAVTAGVIVFCCATYAAVQRRERRLTEQLDIETCDAYRRMLEAQLESLTHERRTQIEHTGTCDRALDTKIRRCQEELGLLG